MAASHVEEGYDLQHRLNATDAPPRTPHLVINIEPHAGPGMPYKASPPPLSPPPSSSSSPRPTIFLDGLRGLAALFVCIQHFVGGFDGNLHEHGFGEDDRYYYIASLPFLRILFSGGSAAVAIFFVLSGYVLTKAPLRLLRDGRRDDCIRSVVSAVIRRPIRLYVPTLAVTFIFAVLMHAPLNLVPVSPWAQPQDTLFMELKRWTIESVRFFNPFRTHGSNQAWFPYSVVVWTIPIELKGSMLVYAWTSAYATGGLRRRINLSCLVISVLGLLQVAEWTMACFLAGLLLADVDTWLVNTPSSTSCFPRRAQTIFHNATFIIGYYLLCQPAHDNHPEFSLNTPGWYHLTLLTPRAYDKSQYYRYFHSWGAFLVLYSALRTPWLQCILLTRPLQYLGKVYFMLYLIHLPLINIMSERLQRLFGQIPPSSPNGGNKEGEGRWYDSKLWIPDVGPVGMSSRFLVCLAIWLPICLVVASYATRVLDRPSVRIGKTLVRKLRLGSKGLDERMCPRSESGGLGVKNLATLTGPDRVSHI